MTGYYALIQYMANPARHEGVNVGVVLFDTRDNKAYMKAPHQPMKADKRPSVAKLKSKIPEDAYPDVDREIEVVRFFAEELPWDRKETGVQWWAAEAERRVRHLRIPYCGVVDLTKNAVDPLTELHKALVA